MQNATQNVIMQEHRTLVNDKGPAVTMTPVNMLLNLSSNSFFLKAKNLQVTKYGMKNLTNFS